MLLNRDFLQRPKHVALLPTVLHSSLSFGVLELCNFCVTKRRTVGRLLTADMCRIWKETVVVYMYILLSNCSSIGLDQLATTTEHYSQVAQIWAHDIRNTRQLVRRISEYFSDVSRPPASTLRHPLLPAHNAHCISLIYFHHINKTLN
jgi:hypothetical protein